MRQIAVYMCKMVGLAAAAAVLVLATSSSKALAQECVGPDCLYSLSYYSNANTPAVGGAPAAPDATLRLVNDGFNGDSSPNGDLCASIYVFDNNEEMLECCSCKITPNGLLTLGVNTNLTKNPLTGTKPKRGVVKVLSEAPPSTPTNPCDPTTPGISPNPGIHGWLTHIQKIGTGATISWPQTEEELQDASLSGAELGDLAEDCTVAIELGSGQGTCSCLDAGR